MFVDYLFFNFCCGVLFTHSVSLMLNTRVRLSSQNQHRMAESVGMDLLTSLKTYLDSLAICLYMHRCPL